MLRLVIDSEQATAPEPGVTASDTLVSARRALAVDDFPSYLSNALRAAEAGLELFIRREAS